MGNKKNLEQLARGCIEKTSGAAEQANKVPEESHAAQKHAKELSDEELGHVTGSGNPFLNVARVPPKTIDDKLRNKT